MGYKEAPMRVEPFMPSFRPPQALPTPPGLLSRNRAQTLQLTPGVNVSPTWSNTSQRATNTHIVRPGQNSSSSPWSPAIGPAHAQPITQTYGAFAPPRESELFPFEEAWAGPNSHASTADILPPTGAGAQMGSYYIRDSVSSGSSTGQWPKSYQQRRPSNRDEFDGPSQFLPKQDLSTLEPQEDDLPTLPTNLYSQEQDEILTQVSQRLAQCAFDFIAKYQFPIPLEQDKRPVRVASDREWAEWVHLLKRLATKRRIPTRVLYNGQIRQFTTILESSLDMRPASRSQSRPLKDDRNILQLISSGLQVAKILKDAQAMHQLNEIYVQTEMLINSRRSQAASFSFDSA